MLDHWRGCQHSSSSPCWNSWLQPSRPSKQWGKQGWVDLWSLLNKCGKNMVWGQTRNGLRVWLTESGGYVYAKASKYLNRLQLLEHQNIDHTTESTAKDRPNQQSQLRPTDRPWQFPTQGPSNHVRIHAAHDNEHDCQDSFTLYKGGIHSPWVMTILVLAFLGHRISTSVQMRIIALHLGVFHGIESIGK
jgi:hypothetical protein